MVLHLIGFILGVEISRGSHHNIRRELHQELMGHLSRAVSCLQLGWCDECELGRPTVIDDTQLTCLGIQHVRAQPCGLNDGLDKSPKFLLVYVKVKVIASMLHTGSG